MLKFLYFANLFFKLTKAAVTHNWMLCFKNMKFFCSLGCLLDNYSHSSYIWSFFYILCRFLFVTLGGIFREHFFITKSVFILNPLLVITWSLGLSKSKKPESQIIKTVFLSLLFGPLLRGQPHSPNFYHCVFTFSTQRSLGAS